MPRLYDDIGRYGAAAQGRAVKARQEGRCTVCGRPYAKGDKVLRLDDTRSGTHPDCAYQPVVVSYQQPERP